MTRSRRGWRFRWSLRVRLVAVVLLALLPIAGLLALLWQGARDRDRDDTLTNLAQTAEAVAVIADDLFDEGIVFGQVLATDPTIKSLDPAQFGPRLSEVAALAPHFRTIMVVDGTGMVVGWTSSDPLPSPAPDVASRAFFARVVSTGQPTTIPVANDQGLHTLSQGVAVPITGPDGAVVGLVAIMLSPEHIAQRLGQIDPFSGQVFSLIDPNGRVAMLVGPTVQPLADLSWEQRERRGLAEVQSALAGTPATSATFRGPLSGMQRLAAFAPTTRHGWVVSATWTVEQALGPTRQAEQRELAIFVTIVLLILAGVLAASHTVIAPLRRLAEQARQLGDGRFRRIDAAPSDDEIGDLTEAFNGMGERLSQTLSDLQRERARLETILLHLPVGVVIREAPSGKLILGNAMAAQITRRSYALEADTGPSLSRRSFHPDGRPFAPDDAPIVRALRDGAEVRDDEVLVRHDDGTDATLLMSAAPIRDEHGTVVAAVTTFDDVTTRRRTEARLREREALLGALVDQFPGSVAVLDRDLRYVLAAGRSIVNPRQVREELVGQRASDIYVNSSDPAAETSYYQRAFAGETVSFETTINGTAIRVTIVPLRSATGSVEHVLNISFDVTEELDQRDRTVRDEKLRALGQMAGGIAHNVNQTLALVTGYGEMVRAGLDEPEPNRDELCRMLRIVERAAYDGGETVKRLLTFARGQDDERHHAIDVSDLLHEVEQLTAPRWREVTSAEGHPVELRVRAAPGLSIVGSRPGLREALTNLVFNALDAMPNGGSIDLSARQDGDRVVIDVQDSGTGVPPEVQHKIFEPFFTTKGEHGTGLGLAMVFGIVRRHGGLIDLSSAPGCGTTFHLSLPAGTAEPVEPASSAEGASPRTLRILVVDDEDRLAALAAGMLRRDGHEAVATNSGELALDQLRAETFDLMISDLSMGDGMNGWELADAAGKLTPGLPVLLVTGWGAAIDEDEARTRGVCAVLAKPFRTADLRNAIARVIPA